MREKNGESRVRHTWEDSKKTKKEHMRKKQKCIGKMDNFVTNRERERDRQTERERERVREREREKKVCGGERDEEKIFDQ